MNTGKIVELMLAENYDDVQYKTPPYIGQPKLNGFRAYWDGCELASRNQVIWKESKLPHIYEKLKRFSAEHPDILLDGELYCHGMPRQEISKRVSGGIRHLDYKAIDFHVFDIIDDALTAEQRLLKLLETHYEPFVPPCRIEKMSECDDWLKRFVECGFEGLMLRSPNEVYQHKRTEHLIKLKPWQQLVGTIVGSLEGEGKYKDMCGALLVKAGNIKFRVSGGLKDHDRRVIWENRLRIIGQSALVKYRELAASGKPLEPQLHSFSFKP
jgi:DNA ligase-1